MRSPARFAVAALVGALAVAPLPAAVYTVALTNGTSIDTRYEPEDAAWDRTKICFVDEFGNVVALPKSEVVGVTSDFEAKGFGSMIDDTTMELGWAPNDALDADSPEGQAAAAAQAIYDQQRQPTTFGQFVEPNSTQGMPANWVGLGSTAYGPPPTPVPIVIPAPSAPAATEAPPGDGGQ